MAKGVVLQSASFEPGGEEARDEKLASVLENAGYEPVEPEVPGGPEVEAAPHDGGNEETFPAPRKSRKERAIERATAPLLERIKQLEAGQPHVVQAEPVAAQSKPQKADFANEEAYEDALVRWGTEQAAQRQYDERILRSYAEQVKRSKETHPDWNALKQKFDADDIFIGRATQLAILEDEAGGEITYYLMRHPDKAAELGRMSQVSAVKEIARISARLSGNGEGYGRPRPRVPAPVRTVSTGGSTAASTPADIAARPNYPGKARDFRRALAER